MAFILISRSLVWPNGAIKEGQIIQFSVNSKFADNVAVSQVSESLSRRSLSILSEKLKVLRTGFRGGISFWGPWDGRTDARVRRGWQSRRVKANVAGGRGCRKCTVTGLYDRMQLRVSLLSLISDPYAPRGQVERRALKQLERPSVNADNSIVDLVLCGLPALQAWLGPPTGLEALS